MSSKWLVPATHQHKPIPKAVSPTAARLTDFFTRRKLKPLWKHMF